MGNKTIICIYFLFLWWCCSVTSWKVIINNSLYNACLLKQFWQLKSISSWNNIITYTQNNNNSTQQRTWTMKILLVLSTKPSYLYIMSMQHFMLECKSFNQIRNKVSQKPYVLFALYLVNLFHSSANKFIIQWLIV